MTDQELRSDKLRSERGPVPPAYLAHIVRRTSQPAALVDWYKQVLGARVVYSDETLAFLTYDEEHHRLAIIAIPGLPARSEYGVGTDHVAFTYTDLGDLLYTFERLKGAGIEPFWCINHGPTTSLYYKDPDGNCIELQIDNFASPAETDDWLKSGAFTANPIGVIFDPQDLLARYKAGEPTQDLVARPSLPEGVSPFDMLRA
ncbi:MAG: catechol-2,3-dioxygenase [Hyphomicrobiaceae bacterium]|jgi:catechol-2,3-dioxygenase